VVTDAFRAHILRLLGHRVDAVEWIGGEHTPRNTMIRAIFTGSPAATELWWGGCTYLRTSTCWLFSKYVFSKTECFHSPPLYMTAMHAE
jgi:hypothetical protein